jgi:hypothetical protein
VVWHLHLSFFPLFGRLSLLHLYAVGGFHGMCPYILMPLGLRQKCLHCFRVIKCHLGPSIWIILTSFSWRDSFSWIHSCMSYADTRGLH